MPNGNYEFDNPTRRDATSPVFAAVEDKAGEPRARLTEQEARSLTAAAIADGRIPMDEPCCVCGAAQGRTKGDALLVVRHHPDLTGRPLWTIPLCRKDHRRVHAGLILDPGLGRTRERPAPAWMSNPARRESVIRGAIREGRRPPGMSRDEFDRELDARGARLAFNRNRDRMAATVAVGRRSKVTA